MQKFSIKKLTILSMVAALYVALTLSLSSLSYGNIQFRVAEALILLCFYRKEYCYSMVVGCFIANIFSPMPVDMFFGTFATLLAVICITKSPNIFIASIFPVIINALIVGFELYKFCDLPFILSAVQVAVGEFVCVCIVGIVIFKLLEKNDKFMKLIKFE